MAFPVWLIGVLLAVVSAVISNLGLNLQKRNHLNNSHTIAAAEKAKKREGREKTAKGGDRPHQHHHAHHRHHHHAHRRHSQSAAAGVSARKHRVQPNDILIRHRSAAEQGGPAASKAELKRRRKQKKAKAAGEGDAERQRLLDVQVQQVLEVPDGQAYPAPSPTSSSQCRAHPPLHFASLAEGEAGVIADLLSSSSSYIVPPERLDSLPSPVSSVVVDGGAAPLLSPSSSSAAAVDADGAPLPPPSEAHSHKSADEAAASINYTRQLTWQCGLALVILGSLFDFAALAFASQSQIAPLGSLTLVSNVFLAPLLLKEKLSRRDVVCTLVIVAGAALAVMCAAHDDATLTTKEMFGQHMRHAGERPPALTIRSPLPLPVTHPSPLSPLLWFDGSGYFVHIQFVLYAATVVVVVLSLRVMTWKAGVLRRRAHTSRDAAQRYVMGMKFHRFGYAAAAGIMGAQSVLFAKCTSTLFRATISGDGNMFVYPGTYAVLAGLGVTIFFQIRWLNSGLRLFPALYVVPVFQSFWILVSVISGMVFFDEVLYTAHTQGRRSCPPSTMHSASHSALCVPPCQYQGVLDEPLNAFGFCSGLMLTIGGVYVLSQRAGHDTAADTEHREEEVNGAEAVDPPVDGFLRRDSLSSVSSFDTVAAFHHRSRSLSGDRDFDDLHLHLHHQHPHSHTPYAHTPHTPMSSSSSSVGMMKQPLLGEEKERSAYPAFLHVNANANVTPSRSRRGHAATSALLPSPTSPSFSSFSSPSTIASASSPSMPSSIVSPYPPPYHPPHHAHPLSPLPESLSPSTSSQPRGRVDSDPIERHHSSERAESAPQPIRTHRPTLTNLLPPTVEIEPVLPSHSFSHANEFLQTPSPAVDLRRARSASTGHVGEDVQRQLRLTTRKQTKKPFNFTQALSALVSPPVAASDASHFRRLSWHELSRTAAMNAPGLSAFAHAIALRNYERPDGEREEEEREDREARSPTDDSCSDTSASSSDSDSEAEADDSEGQLSSGVEEEEEEGDEEEREGEVDDGEEAKRGGQPLRGVHEAALRLADVEEEKGVRGGRARGGLGVGVVASASAPSPSARQSFPSPAVSTASTATPSSSSSPAPSSPPFRAPLTAQHSIRIPPARRSKAGTTQ